MNETSLKCILNLVREVVKTHEYDSIEAAGMVEDVLGELNVLEARLLA